MFINNDAKPGDLEPNSNITGLENKTEKECIESLGIIANKIIKMPGKILLISALAMGIGINFVEANNKLGCETYSIFNPKYETPQMDEYGLTYDIDKQMTL